MINNFFYESKNNFCLIKRESANRKKTYGQYKKMGFSGKHIAKMFSKEVSGK